MEEDSGYCGSGDGIESVSDAAKIANMVMAGAGQRWRYYTILYYTILYHTILYYTILYYTILYYTILYYTILYYTITIL